MTEQTRPDATVTIPRDLWPQFRMWVLQNGYALEPLGEDESVAEQYELTEGPPSPEAWVSRNAGPWI